MNEFYTVLTGLIVLTALFSYVNIRFIRLPATIGVMLISLLCSLVLVVLGKFYPGLLAGPAAIVGGIDFETVLMRMMLSFLLFAGAIHIDLEKLRRELPAITAYATIGVLISTALIGGAMYGLFGLFGMEVPLIYCFLFGALISPTDPIAVLGILKEARIPPDLEVRIAGESLFNDGVGVVIFVSLLQIALSGGADASLGGSLLFFLQEAGGGILWGLLLGYGGFWMMRSIDHYQVEVLISLALVMGGYLLASSLHISGPLAMVVAGIFIGNKGKREAMSDVTKDYLIKFWELIDEILNALLFLLIGLEMIVIAFSRQEVAIGLMAILVVLLGRVAAVLVPSLLLSVRQKFEGRYIPILTWGGLRGGISVALALSLPRNEYRDPIIAVTYIVVVFSIVVQGMTVKRVVRRFVPPAPDGEVPQTVIPGEPAH